MASSPCQEASSSPSQKVYPIWRTRRWLEQCKNNIDEKGVEWWLLVRPLTDGSDMATWMLEWRLVATWHWTVKTSRSLICPPALAILNIGQFLDKDVTEESALESGNISEGDMDDEDAGEESSQTLPLALQESEEAPVRISAEAEPTILNSGGEQDNWGYEH